MAIGAASSHTQISMDPADAYLPIDLAKSFQMSLAATASRSMDMLLSSTKISRCSTVSLVSWVVSVISGVASPAILACTDKSITLLVPARSRMLSTSSLVYVLSLTMSICEQATVNV